MRQNHETTGQKDKTRLGISRNREQKVRTRLRTDIETGFCPEFFNSLGY